MVCWSGHFWVEPLTFGSEGVVHRATLDGFDVLGKFLFLTLSVGSEVTKSCLDHDLNDMPLETRFEHARD